MQTKKVKFTISTNGESSNVSEIIEIVVDNQLTESEMIDAINDKYLRWVHSMNIGGWSFINSEMDSNDVEIYDPHEASLVSCDLCNHKWVAVRPKGLKILECPNCNNITSFENIETN